MMVPVIAVSSFAAVLDNGEVVAAGKGEQVMLPQDRAEALIKAKLAKPVAATKKSAPRNKSRSTETRQTK